MATDLERAFTTIKAKRQTLDMLYSYAEGEQPLKYSTEKLKEAFDDIDTHFQVNWCSVVVEATLDRLILNGFDIPDVSANKAADTLFKKLRLAITSSDAHRASLEMTNAYMIVWKQPDGTIEAYYNDPRLCQCFYDAARPNVKTYAAKWFIRDEEHNEITLYYPDRLEHWVGKSRRDDYTQNSKDFILESTKSNPYGVIPVFELKTPGEITKILSLQDAENKLFADMMVGAEFGAFPQRWIISQADAGNLRNDAAQNWWIPAGDGTGQAASVGQFQAATLSNYTEAMDKIVSAIAIITRTPKHYFMTTGANISGEALLAMEAPLVKKAQNRQTILSPAWQEVAKFMLQLDGYTVDANDITVSWKRPESVQPFTEAQTRQLAINTGIPLVTQLRREGWTEAEIEQLFADKKAEQEAQKTVAQAVLDTLRVQQEQGNDVTDPEANPAGA